MNTSEDFQTEKDELIAILSAPKRTVPHSGADKPSHGFFTTFVEVTSAVGFALGLVALLLSLYQMFLDVDNVLVPLFGAFGLYGGLSTMVGSAMLGMLAEISKKLSKG